MKYLFAKSKLLNLIGNLSPLTSHLSPRRGFTLIELIVVMGIFSTLIGITSLSLLNMQRKSMLSSAVQVFTADLKSQQIRAMVGENDAAGEASDYGVHFETDSYTQFRESFYDAGNSSNFKVNLPNNIQFVPVNLDMIFEKGSGEIKAFDINPNLGTITVQDISNNSQKEIKLNKYGVVNSVDTGP